MKQYCRYCVNLVVGDTAYCRIRKQEMKDISCKRVNNCGEFDFIGGPKELQDAFQENKRGYRPRKDDNEQVDGQIKIKLEV